MSKAIRAARHQSKHGPAFKSGMCKMETREAYGIASDGTVDAARAWLNAAVKHRVTDTHKIPRGVPIFWTGGSEGHGHVAISCGPARWWLRRLRRGRNVVPMCWSVDKLRSGHWDRVPVDSITNDWRLTFVGWTEDLDGQPIAPLRVRISRAVRIARKGA